MAGALQLEVINEALLTIGDRPLNGLADPSNDDDPSASQIAVQIYDTVVNAALSRQRWRFCMDSELLSALPAASVPAGYEGAYARPNEALAVLSVHDGSRVPVEFNVFGNIIATGSLSTTTLYAEFTRRVDESLWPPLFRMGVVLNLASMFALSIMNDPRMSEALSQQAAATFGELAGKEAQGRTPRRVDLSPLLIGRRGGRAGKPRLAL